MTYRLQSVTFSTDIFYANDFGLNFLSQKVAVNLNVFRSFMKHRVFTYMKSSIVVILQFHEGIMIDSKIEQ